MMIMDYSKRELSGIQSIVLANNLFPRIKFLDKTKDLEFSMEEGTICHYLFHMCQLKYDVERMEYIWEKARKWVLSSITRLRSEKCTTIRNAFLVSDILLSFFLRKASHLCWCLNRVVE